MLIPIFILGSFWFYCLLVVAVLALYYCIDQDWGGGATTTLGIGALALWLFGNVNLFSLAFHHPVTALLGVVAYFIVGTFWLFFRWELFVRDRNNDVARVKARYEAGTTAPTVTVETLNVKDMHYREVKVFSENQLSRMTPEAIAEVEKQNLESKKYEVDRIYQNYNDRLWSNLSTESLVERDPKGKDTVKPYVRNHKAQLMTWMSYWPWSMSWFFLHDSVHRLCKAVVEALHDKLQRRSDAIFANVTIGVTEPTAPVEGTK